MSMVVGIKGEKMKNVATCCLLILGIVIASILGFYSIVCLIERRDNPTVVSAIEEEPISEVMQTILNSLEVGEGWEIGKERYSLSNQKNNIHVHMRKKNGQADLFTVDGKYDQFAIITLNDKECKMLYAAGEKTRRKIALKMIEGLKCPKN